MSEFLFVYGTLLPGCVPGKVAALSARLRFVSAATVPGLLYHLGEYPGAVPDPSGRHRVSGAVLQLPADPHILAQLDAYEEFDPRTPAASEYVRVLHPVSLADGRTLPCWIYWYNWSTAGLPIIPTGDWRNPAANQ